LKPEALNYKPFTLNPKSLTLDPEPQDENSGGIQKAAVNISFGGLLMHLRADPKNLQDVDIDNRLYVLIRKIS